MSWTSVFLTFWRPYIHNQISTRFSLKNSKKNKKSVKNAQIELFFEEKVSFVWL